MSEWGEDVDFMCDNCGAYLDVYVVQYNIPFTKKEFKDAMAKDEYSVMYQPDFDVIQIRCDNCEHPALSEEDADMLSDIGEIEYI